MGNARARKIPAQLVEDEDYQLRHERVAGIDIAKAKADVCTRLPPAREGGAAGVAGGGGPRDGAGDPGAGRAAARRRGRAGGHGGDVGLLADLVLPAGGRRADRAAGQPRPRPAAGRAAEDRPAGRAVDRPAGRDGPAAPVVRAAAGDPGAARPDPHPAAAGPRPHPGMAAAGEAPGGRPGQAVIGGLALARTKTARDILEAIADGERDPKALAALAAAQVKGGRAAVEQALDGMLLGDHHPMLIRVHLDHITFLDRSVAAVEDEIEAALDAIPAAWGISADGVPSPDPGPGAAALTAAERLAEIPGVSPKLAMAIIAETGLDMTRFPTAAHLVSWAGLAPVARQSGPRNRKPKKGQGDAYLKGYCTQAANGAARTETFLGERLRRLSRRLGGNRAKCAVARSILVIIWHLLADPAARFTDLGPDWHERKADRDRKIRAHLRQLQALGLDVTVTPAA